MRETQVWSLGWEDSLEEAMATHSSIVAWRIPWTEEPGGLQSMGSQRTGHNWATMHSTASPNAVVCWGARGSGFSVCIWKVHISVHNKDVLFTVLNTTSFATQVVWGPGDRNTYLPVLSFSHNNQLARKKGLPFTSSLPQEQGCEPETCLQDTVSTQGEKHLPSPHVINSPHWSYSRVWIPTAFSPHPPLVLGRHSQKQVDADGWLCRPMNS